MNSPLNNTTELMQSESKNEYKTKKMSRADMNKRKGPNRVSFCTGYCSRHIFLEAPGHLPKRNQHTLADRQADLTGRLKAAECISHYP